MPIPDYQEIMLPLLNIIADSEVHTVRELKEPLTSHFELNDSEVNDLLPSGQQTTFHNRLSWAKTYLLRAGLLEKVRRGHFKISERGQNVLANPPKQIDNAFLSQFPEYLEFKNRSNSGRAGEAAAGNPDDTGQTPEEALQSAYRRVRDDLVGEILGQVMSMPSYFFEKLVLDINGGNGIRRRSDWSRDTNRKGLRCRDRRSHQ